jgi:hypothetical protein
MRLPATALTFLLLAAPPIAAEDPIDTAVTIRNTVLRAEPTQASDVVAEIPANTSVEVFQRQRLRVRLAAADDGEAEQGWLRFTELRFGAETNDAAPSPEPETGAFAGFSRSVSGFLGSFRRRSSRTTQKTATIGIRGLTVADLEAAHPDVKALAAISRFAISKADAQQFAAAGGLAARDVPQAQGNR